MSVIAVVDCGMGNLHSVVAGVRRANAAVRVIVADSDDAIRQADKVIFPGDGHFDACVNAIDARGLRDAIGQAAREKPFLGICVGMQVLFAASEEGGATGLGIMPETVRRLPAGKAHKVPHMGWNQTYHRRNHSFTATTPEATRFYYVHSYYAPVGNWTLMTVSYGVTFSAVIACGQLVATQFHPEKSGEYGIRLLENFVNA